MNARRRRAEVRASAPWEECLFRLKLSSASMPRLEPTAVLTFRSGARTVRADQVAVLEAIERTGSLTEAAKDLRVSYKHLWTMVQKMEATAGRPLVKAIRGGRGGGGRATLTADGRRLLDEFRRLSGGLRGIVREEGFWEAIGLKLSARNRLSGTIRSVEKDGAAARIVLDVSGPTRLSALITREAADDLDLQVGDTVDALVKSTEVMLAKRVAPRHRRSPKA